jgi:hypothetical protein
MKYFRQKLCRENQNTYFVFNNPPPSKIVPFKRKCGKSMVQTDRPPCLIPKATNTHTHTHRICNTCRIFHRMSGCTNALQCCITVHPALSYSTPCPVLQYTLPCLIRDPPDLIKNTAISARNFGFF